MTKFEFDPKAKFEDGICPVSGCGGRFQPTIDDIKNGRVVRCQNGHEIQIPDKSKSLASSEKKLDKALEDIRKTIERGNRRRGR